MDDRTRAAQVEDLSNFFSELNRENDRGLALVGAAVLDDRLGATLRSFFCEERPAKKLLDDASAPLGTFSSH